MPVYFFYYDASICSFILETGKDGGIPAAPLLKVPRKFRVHVARDAVDEIEPLHQVEPCKLRWQFIFLDRLQLAAR